MLPVSLILLIKQYIVRAAMTFYVLVLFLFTVLVATLLDNQCSAIFNLDSYRHKRYHNILSFYLVVASLTTHTRVEISHFHIKQKAMIIAICQSPAEVRSCPFYLINDYRIASSPRVSRYDSSSRLKLPRTMLEE